MTEKDKTTENSKVELTDEQLEAAEGGAVDFFLKLDGIKGESADSKAELDPRVSKLADRIGSKTLKGKIANKGIKF